MMTMEQPDNLELARNTNENAEAGRWKGSQSARAARWARGHRAAARYLPETRGCEVSGRCGRRRSTRCVQGQSCARTWGHSDVVPPATRERKSVDSRFRGNDECVALMGRCGNVRNLHSRATAGPNAPLACLPYAHFSCRFTIPVHFPIPHQPRLILYTASSPRRFAHACTGRPPANTTRSSMR